MTTLQDLYGSFAQALQGGDLTLTAGSSGAPAIDSFLATLPAQALTLHGAHNELRDHQQPATLVVYGTVTDTWALPGLSTASLSPQTVTVTYSQAGPADPITGGLTASATLTIGSSTITLDGSLDASTNTSLTLAWQQGQHGTLSLADAVAVLTDASAATWVPADVPVFGSLQISSLSVSLCYALGSTTTMAFTLNAPPHGSWGILSGQHVLQQIGVTLATSYQATAGHGPRRKFSGNVHATLDLGTGIGVIVGFSDDVVWDIELDATGGLPAIGTIAALAGAQDEVSAGLAAVGLGDVTLQAVHLGINRTDGTLAYISMQGSMQIAGATFIVHLELPAFSFGGRLSDATPISLTPLLTSLLGDIGGLLDIAITELYLDADPSSGTYSMIAELADGQLTAGGYGLDSVNLELAKQSTGMTGTLGAAITLAGTQVSVAGSYGPGWTVTGQLDTLSLAGLIGEVLAAVGLPDPLATLQLTNINGSWNLTTGAYSFSGQLDMDIVLGPQTLATTLDLAVDSAVDPQSNARTTTGALTGSLTLGSMTFDLRYAFTPGQQVLTGTWNAQGQVSLADLASAFALVVPVGDVTLPALTLTSMSFTLDWSTAGEQAFELSAVTSYGEAFFVVARPAPGQPWGFAFGAAIEGTTTLSQVFSLVGVDLPELDFITLSGAFFLVASAQFPSLQIPNFTPLQGRTLMASQGITAGVLVDLGSTPDRPDVTTLKTVLSGRPPVLLGEVTLSTNIAVIALTVQLDGNLVITGPGTTSVTLTDVSLIFKPDPLAITLTGSVSFPLGDVTILATGLLTVAADEVLGALNVQGQNGEVLPIPLGFQGVHLTDIGVEIGVTYEPPSLVMGLLGRFVIGPGTPVPQGLVQSRPLAAMPPANEFVLILGLEGEVPIPLLLSMFLQELSISAAAEAFTNQQPQDLPSLLNDIKANDLMIYWCDAPAGLQQPDGTWAYPGYGFNAILDLLGLHAYAELKISSTSGITGDACIDPLGIAGVISLTGSGTGTPAAYAGQITVQPGGAVEHVSTIASPYLDISWQVTLFSTMVTTVNAVNAQLTDGGFTFWVEGSAYGFSSALSCAFQAPDSLTMTFSVSITADVDLGTLNGIHLGHVHLASVGVSCSLAAQAVQSLAITIDAGFTFNGTSYMMPPISASTPYSSLPDVPAAIISQIESQGPAIFAGFIDTVAHYAGVVEQGLVIVGDDLGSVLKTGYGQTASQAATVLKTAGYTVSEAGNYVQNAFSSTPDQLHSALDAAGYGASEIGNYFHSLGGDFDNWASSNLDPTKWG